MKTVIIFTLIVGSIVLFSSCKDVIDIDLDSNDPKLVINGVVTDINDTLSVNLSKSVDYYEPVIYSTVSGAIISVSDKLGNNYRLNEIIPGIYSEKINVAEGIEYSLKVIFEGEEYTAKVEMPYKVNIDSLSFESTPEYMEFTGGYMVKCHFNDPAQIENYYRLKVHQFDKSADSDKILYVYVDAFVDGNEITMRWNEKQFSPDDTVVVELQSLAESTYDYYRTLSSLFEDGMIGNANPANPITNLSNGALGYFGAYTISRDTIIITEIE